VLELGSGCGLVGIAAGVLGAEQVILTDLPYCLPLMRANVDRHRAYAMASGCLRIECATCDWFDPPPMNEFFLNGDFEADVILIADCVWVQELVRPLLATLEKLLEGRSHPLQVLISYQRRGKAVHEDFWSGIHSLFPVIHQSDTSHLGLEKPGCLHLLECYTTA
jgi:predicted nicotinamide N-methyase